jgi:hypothetical protein
MATSFGVRLIDIRAELTNDLGPATVQGANFNIKALPASNGIGCEDDPCLTLAEFDNALRVRKEGTGALLLGSNVHDPVADIKVVQLRKATYIEGDLIPAPAPSRASQPRSSCRISTADSTTGPRSTLRMCRPSLSPRRRGRPVLDSNRLDGKTALVTGAGGEIGAATIRLMAAQRRHRGSSLSDRRLPAR